MGAVEDAIPQISGLSPDTGLTTGNTSVTITGSGFTGVSAVMFGTRSASFTDTSDSSLTALSPPQSAGPVAVTVKAATGTTAVNPADDFTYTVQESPTVVPCAPSCTDSVTSAAATSVTASGTSGVSGTASMSLVVNTGTMSCGRHFDYLTPVSTLSTPGFASSAVVTVTETLTDPSTQGVKVCFEESGSTTNRLLRRCRAGTPTPPCLQSLTEQSGSVVATFLSGANDPRFWTGGPDVSVRGFSPSQGSPGTSVTITGKNLKQVSAVVIGGVDAPIVRATDAKLVVTVADGSQTGQITVTARSGDVVAVAPFTVTPSGG
jgi:hypothetical protein